MLINSLKEQFTGLLLTRVCEQTPFFYKDSILSDMDKFKGLNSLKLQR